MGPGGEKIDNLGVLTVEVGTRGGARGSANVSARGADDANMRDEVAQRDVSDAESISGDGIREPRRSKSPSDPTLREIEDHALTGHASFRSWCAAYCSGGKTRGAQSCNCGWVDAKIQDRSQMFSVVQTVIVPQTSVNPLPDHSRCGSHHWPLHTATPPTADFLLEIHPAKFASPNTSMLLSNSVHGHLQAIHRGSKWCALTAVITCKVFQ